ncbi:nuclear transport factor 2 family protein [Mycobacterium sp. DL592]|uniref:nuclear transport factor 2 family protein n=1 Tax=Mycobacterium sp. DL592 TaxID=2675524 RepID=UPI0014207691|nr:nuclear transport factor 2 family protein [Mycobacterium sp. DL592]
MNEDRLATLERRLAVFEDESAIARIIASYGPLVDAGEAQAVAALWTEDGSYDVGDWNMSGRAEIIAMVQSGAHQGLMARGACHFFGPPVITVDGDEATAVCQSIILVRREAGGYHAMRAGVHLLTLRRAESGWQILTRVARQLDGGTEAFDLITEGLPT